MRFNAISDYLLQNVPIINNASGISPDSILTGCKRQPSAVKEQIRIGFKGLDMRKSQQGFTLIELMIVVAIIGILAAVAIPAYQDYTIRAQISEGLSLASAAKAAVVEYYMENGAWPSKNDDAGLADKHDIMGKYTEHISVKDNVIEIKYEYDANAAITNEKIELTATNNDGSISWTCASAGTIKPNHLPAGCR